MHRSPGRLLIFLMAVLSIGMASPVGGQAGEPLPLVFTEDFEEGAERWRPTDPVMWKITQEPGGNRVYHLLGKSNFEPPYRSPFSFSLREDAVVGDFVFTARVKTLQKSLPHRDMCVIFGYQNPARFYYVHLGERTDPHANQIFIVNDAPRVKISERTSEGTPWKDDTWHHVKIVRKVETGLIEVYFDDMQTPQMVAHDKTFTWGKIGLGSFDDMGQWDDVTLHGRVVKPQVP